MTTWVILIIWILFWKMWAVWCAASQRQFFWFLFAWFSPTFGIGEMWYVFYMKNYFPSKRCRECFNLPKVAIYKVGPGGRCECVSCEEEEN